LTRVLAEDLEDNQFSSLVEFLRSRSNGKFARHGKRIEITGNTNKRVKFLLQKFLHANRLSEYRVLDTTAALEIVRIKPERDDKKMKNRAPLKHPVPYGPPIPARSGQNSESNGKANPLRKRHDTGRDTRTAMPQPAFAESTPRWYRNFLRRYVVFRYSRISIFSGFEIVAVRNIRYRQEVVAFCHAYRKKIPKPYGDNPRSSANINKRTIPSNQNSPPSPRYHGDLCHLHQL
jgi:hypothetical protein